MSDEKCTRHSCMHRHMCACFVFLLGVLRVCLCFQNGSDLGRLGRVRVVVGVGVCLCVSVCFVRLARFKFPTCVSRHFLSLEFLEGIVLWTIFLIFMMCVQGDRKRVPSKSPGRHFHG